MENTIKYTNILYVYFRLKDSYFEVVFPSFSHDRFIIIFSKL